MLKINLLPAGSAAAQPCANSALTQPQPLQAASKFTLIKPSVQRLIHQPHQASTGNPFIARSIPFAFSIGQFVEEHWMLSTAIYMAAAIGLLWSIGRSAQKYWPMKEEPRIDEASEPPAEDDFIGPRFAPGSKNLPSGTPLDN